MSIAYFQTRYLASNKKPYKGKPKEIDSSIKWAEHSLNVYEMKHLLEEELTFDERVILRRAIDVAERKRVWHYKRDNFDLRRASFLFETAKKALII